MKSEDILRVALEQSAIDCSCRPEDFLKEKNSVHLSRADDRARRYLTLPHICDLVSYGGNIVAACREDLLGEMETYLAGVTAVERPFETPEIYALNEIFAKADAAIAFQAAYFLPDPEALARFVPHCPYTLRLLGPADFSSLYLPAWQNALCAQRKELDRLAVGAYDGEELVGLAGASADCEGMWQIGVDILPSRRRRGVASALTNRLAREILSRGKVPFYCAAWSNLKSVKNALKSGFRPAWAEVTAKPIAFVNSLRGKGKNAEKALPGGCPCA